MGRRHWRTLATVLVGVATTGGCSASHRGHSSPLPHQDGPPAPVAPVTELSYGLVAAAPDNWNILASGTNQQDLAPVADQVWPSVFTFGPDFNPVLNSALVQSATEISESPQTIVYKINPKAIWSDGTPVTGGDFVYNWQSQSGQPGGSDLGGRSFTPASTVGYSTIKSVAVSAGSPDTVTVVLASPDPDWTALFRHLLPAHVAEGIGFDVGFADPVSDLVSDGPYVVASYDPSGVVHLVRNPSYSGPPAAALELDIHYLPDTGQLLSALVAGQISCADVPATSANLSALKTSTNLAVNLSSASAYIDLVFNAGSGPMSSPDARAAVTRDVSSASVVSDVFKVEPQTPPVGNRFLVPGEAGYTANAFQVSTPLERVPTSAPPATIRLAVASTDPEAVVVAQAIAERLDASGYAVAVTPAGDTTKLSAGSWDLAVVLRQLTPWPFEEVISYESGQTSNFARLSDSALDSAVQSVIQAATSQQKALIDQVDQAAWDTYADVPMVALPELLACQAGVSGPTPNASPDGAAYNAASWGLRGGSS